MNMFGLTCATFVWVSLALRPEADLKPDKEAVEDQSVAAAVADLGALRDVDRSTPADSLAVLGEANHIISKLSSPGPPPSLSDETKATLSSLITFIQETVYGEMDVGHEADMNSLNSTNTAVSTCNAALQNGMLPTGAIGAAEQHAKDKQEAYKSAVQELEQKEAEKTRKKDAFDAHMGTIMQLSTCNAFPSDRSEDSWTQYFNVEPDVAMFNQQKLAFESHKQAYHDADDAVTQAIAALASSKGALEDAYCSMITLMQTGCNDLSTCYPTALQDFTDASAKAKANANLRINAHAAGEEACKQVRLMLGLDAQPVERDYNLEIPTPESQAPCSVSMVIDTQTWEDFLDASSCDGLPQVENPTISMEFTSCGATGKEGPKQEACNSEYGNDNIKVSAGYQLVTIQKTGVYSLSVSGARGGHHGGGKGGSAARVNRTVSLQASDQLVVVVGQVGWDNPAHGKDWGGGGGGGSFVAKKVASGGDLLTKLNIRVELLAAAGGGAGLQDRRDSGQALGGRAEEGNPSSRAQGGFAGGGAGYQQDGSKNVNGGQVAAGSFLSSAVGGEWSGRDRWGGFGGGGAPWNGGGGGGGYDGGDCTIGGTDHDCYGGSSYGGTTAEADMNDGPGTVLFQSQF